MTIKKSTIDQKAKSHIEAKLKKIESDYDVLILTSCESGSRAWGFPSADSDYDIRFVYARKRDDYLSLKDYGNVIEKDIDFDDVLEADIDISGWDIRKALLLSLKSNPTLTEWLTSPIQYLVETTDKFREKLYNETTKYSHLQYIKYHYYKMCLNAFDGTTKRTGIKKYCYSLRPALTLKYLRDKEALPPMDVFSMASKMELDGDLTKEIAELFETKLKGSEKDLMDFNYNRVSSFIEEVLSEEEEKSNKPIPSDSDYKDMDKFLLTIVNS